MKFQNLKGHQNNMIGSKISEFNHKKTGFYTLNFVECLITPIYKSLNTNQFITKRFLRET